MERPCVDALVWAEEFTKTKQAVGWELTDIDGNLMLGWFANAIMDMHDVKEAELDTLRKKNTERKKRIEHLKKTLMASIRRAETAEAKVKALETQLAGRTYCHSDEAVEARLKRYEEALDKIAGGKSWCLQFNHERNCVCIAGEALKGLNSEE